jgi:hypothetical protein
MKNERMQARRYFKRGRMVPFKLVGRLVVCRDYDHADPERYMLKNYLWRSAVPTGRGCLCLACLEKRLGRPLVADDFGDRLTTTIQTRCGICRT